MHIVDMVSFWARTMPRRPAVIQPDGVITYRALAHAIELAAEHFARSIPDKTKPVAVALDDAPRMLAACLGLMRAGYSIVPATKALFDHLGSIGVNTLVHERGGAPLPGGSNVLFNDSWLSTGAGAAAQVKLPRYSHTSPTDIIFFTSGTTGKPKHFVMTQGAWDQRMLLPSTTTFANFERALIVPGLASAYGFTRSYETLYLGKTACFARFGEPMLWLVNTYDIDMIIASTQQALSLADIQAKTAHYPLAAMKTLNIGGGSISPEGVERLKNHLCRNVIVRYGSTEAGSMAVAPYDMIAGIPGAVGFVDPEVEVAIVDQGGRVLAVGAEGFVRVRSSQTIQAGYKPDGWFYPGDLGSLTDESVLCILGRTGDVINRGGAKLSVPDFESFLKSLPGVSDAGVCTLMGQSGRMEVWAALVFEPTADVALIQRRIDSNEAFGSQIDKLFVVEAIPRGGETGKVQQAELREMLESINRDSQSPG
jgi:acyl-coenzyme A synthetase/AMP-(fatty) acid ligase